MLKKFLNLILLGYLKTIRTVEKKVPHPHGIIGVWHEDLLACTKFFSHKNIHVLISSSSDGDISANACLKLGYKITRGSSSNNSISVRHLLTSLKNGGSVGMALDGPRGPRKQIKEGNLWLRSQSQLPLFIMDIQYTRFIQLKSWDKFKIPLPFTKVIIDYHIYNDRSKNSINH